MKLKPANPILLARAIAVALITAITALVWDGWWHLAVGRETFWEPPHLFLYASTMIAICLGLYGWYTTREKEWRHLTWALLLVPLSAPFDNMWHNWYGVENFSTAFIVWSPPHLVLFTGLVWSSIIMLSFLRKDNVGMQRFLGALLFTTITSILAGAVVGPLYPFGPYALMHFWGAWTAAMMFVGVFMAASAWIPDTGGGMLVALFFNVYYFIQDPIKIPSKILIPPYPHPPGWIMVFSLVLAALVIDVLYKSKPVLAGLLAGFVYGSILYGLGRYFFEPQFVYSTMDMLIGVVTSAIGGFLAGVIILFFKQLRAQAGIKSRAPSA